MELNLLFQQGFFKENFNFEKPILFEEDSSIEVSPINSLYDQNGIRLYDEQGNGLVYKL